MYTYGPVPSRRLGRSLGVSPIPPKTCSYSCVYCQLGRTNRLTSERKSFFPKEDIFSEIRNQTASSEVDFITFVGDGEPTLSADLGWLIKMCKKHTSKSIAVITNGSLLHRPDVRSDLLEADIVLPTFDAGNAEIFKRINRPHGEINFDVMLQGQIDFRSEFKGQIWLEVMLVHGLNDTEEALNDTKKAVEQINPDRIYITTPIRPPAESWVKPPQPEGIIRAQEILGKTFTVTDNEAGGFGLGSFTNAREAILEIGSRHPLRQEQALEIENVFSELGTSQKLLKEQELVIIPYNKTKYLLPTHFIRSR